MDHHPIMYSRSRRLIRFVLQCTTVPMKITKLYKVIPVGKILSSCWNSLGSPSTEYTVTSSPECVTSLTDVRTHLLGINSKRSAGVK